MSQQPTVDDLTEEQRLRYNHTLIQGLQDTIEDGKEGLGGVPKYIRKVIREKAWEIRVVRQTGQIIEFDTFTEFVEAHPPGGLNTSVDMLKRMCQKDPEALRMLRKATTGKHGGDRRSEEAQNKSVNHTVGQRGDSVGYILSRLKRDGEEELARKVVSEEMSAHAAAIKAGYRKRRFSVYAHRPEKAADKLLDEYGLDGLREIMKIAEQKARRVEEAA